ncbi:transposase-like protein [Salinibacter ruber]|nr:transposase-like protein [Salinibacter ruber]
MAPLTQLPRESLFEKHHRWLLWANMLEQLIQEVRRREKVIWIFLNIDLACCLAGAVLAEKYEEDRSGRRYLKTDGFHEWLDGQFESEAVDPLRINQSHSSTCLIGCALYTRNLT